jgi:hypothetical protein
MCFKVTFERFVLVVAEVQDTAADEVEPTISRPEAEEALAAPFGGPDEVVLYSDPIERAALCCVELIRLRPLPHDNKRVAYKCMQEMLVRYPWAQFDADPEEISTKLDGLGEGTTGGDEFVDWVRAEVGIAAWLRYQQRGDATA